MADVSGLEQAVQARAAQLFSDAVDGMEQKLVQAAPVGPPDVLGRSRPGPKLRETFRRGAREETSDRLRQMIGFTAPSATFSNDLMPGWFRVRTPQQGPFRFWSNTLGREVFTMKVNHPGNVNSDSRGWWDDNATQAAWFVELVASQ